jgi:hypothetical protein
MPAGAATNAAVSVAPPIHPCRSRQAPAGSPGSQRFPSLASIEMTESLSPEAALRRKCSSEPSWWSNGPGDEYGWHAHSYHKVLFCTEGGITFHTDDGDINLVAGGRLDIEPGRRHAATVGRQGVTCVEASR